MLDALLELQRAGTTDLAAAREVVSELPLVTGKTGFSDSWNEIKLAIDALWDDNDRTDDEATGLKIGDMIAVVDDVFFQLETDPTELTEFAEPDASTSA